MPQAQRTYVNPPGQTAGNLGQHPCPGATPLHTYMQTYTTRDVKLSPDLFFGRRLYVWAQNIWVYKSTLADEIKPECIANRLIGVVSVRCSLLISAGEVAETWPARHASTGVIYEPVAGGWGLMNPASWWSRSRDWFTRRSPARPFHPDQPAPLRVQCSSITQ